MKRHNVYTYCKCPYIAYFVLSHRWKIEPFSNNKIQNLNSFLRFLFRFLNLECANKTVLGQLSFLTEHSFHYEVLVWWRTCTYVEEDTCAASSWILTLSTQQFLHLWFKTQRKTEKFSFKNFVFPCKTLMTVKNVLLLLQYITGTSPWLLGQNLKS